jgi:hypothetical protein
MWILEWAVYEKGRVNTATTPTFRAEKKCEMLRSQHGYAAAHVVRINSAKDGDVNVQKVQPDLWARVLSRKAAFKVSKIEVAK